MKATTLAVITLLFVLPLKSAEPLTLQSNNGGEITGTISNNTTPGTINLVRSDGRLYKNVPVSSFSLDSQQLIKSELEKQQKERENADITAESRLRISFQRQKAANNNKYGDIDDRIVTIQPQVTVESDEREKTYRDIKGEVIIIGKEVVSKDRWVILSKQNFTLPTIEPDRKVSWEGTQFECRYDPDYAGFDYEGHVVILRDKSGKIGMIKASNSRWEELVDPLTKAKVATGYNRDFSQSLMLRSTFGLPGR